MSLKRSLHPHFPRAFPRNSRRCPRYSTLAGAQTPPATPSTPGTVMEPKPSAQVPTTSPEKATEAKHQEEEDSPLARRFATLVESALLSSPSKAHKLVSEATATAAISDDLKRALSDRLASAEFNSQHAQAISIANLPANASKHTRDLTSASPWTGTESQEDQVLRMLVDAHKPLKVKSTTPPTVDLRPHSNFGPKPDGVTRVAGARDKSFEYIISKDVGLAAQERSSVRAMFRERFQPGARPVASISALMSLADQRIEDARARGQFDNVPRGMPRIEDHNAQSPFLDTTEYFLNKIIQKQEVLPPWVEKQQELRHATDTFRARIRADWKRLAARAIAARGGSLEDQCRCAQEYAEAEARRARLDRAAVRLRLGEDVPEEELDEAGLREVFRDLEWEKAELRYNTLAIENLNDLTRSYNMMAPEIARKPIFSLKREMARCFEDVAPLVAAEIRRRAGQPQGQAKLKIGGGAARKMGLGGGALHQTTAVKDDDRPNYGFKEFWRGVFGGKDKS